MKESKQIYVNFILIFAVIILIGTTLNLISRDKPDADTPPPAIKIEPGNSSVNRQ